MKTSIDPGIRELSARQRSGESGEPVRPKPESVSLSAAAKRVVAGVALVIAATSETAAHAESGDPVAAEALFQQGRAAMARNDFDAACAAFKESNRLDPGPGTVGNIALCEEQRGHLASAWQWFVQLAGKLPPDDPRRTVAEQHIADLKPRLPTLTLRLAPTAPRGTTVVRDSTALRGASIGTALPVDPGMHRVVVSAPGRADRRYAIELREREAKELVVEPGSPPESAAATGAPEKADSGPSSASPPALAWISFGVGGAGLVLGVTAGVVAGSKHASLSNVCDNAAGTCPPARADDLDAFHAWRTVSTVGYVVGALGVAGGAVLWFTAPHERNVAATGVWLGPASAGVAGRF